MTEWLKHLRSGLGTLLEVQLLCLHDNRKAIHEVAPHVSLAGVERCKEQRLAPGTTATIVESIYCHVLIY